MTHAVFKQQWQRVSDTGEIEFKYSIHLNPDKYKLFVEHEKAKPTMVQYEPVGQFVPWTVNEEIYGFLHFCNGMWTEERT